MLKYEKMGLLKAKSYDTQGGNKIYINKQL